MRGVDGGANLSWGVQKTLRRSGELRVSEPWRTARRSVPATFFVAAASRSIANCVGIESSVRKVTKYVTPGWHQCGRLQPSPTTYSAFGSNSSKTMVSPKVAGTLRRAVRQGSRKWPIPSFHLTLAGVIMSGSLSSGKDTDGVRCGWGAQICAGAFRKRHVDLASYVFRNLGGRHDGACLLLYAPRSLPPARTQSTSRATRARRRRPRSISSKSWARVRSWISSGGSGSSSAR